LSAELLSSSGIV